MNLIIIILGLFIVGRLVFIKNKAMGAGIQLAAVLIVLYFLL